MTSYTKIGVNNNDFYITCANIGITRNTLHHNQFNTLHLNQGYATIMVNPYNLDSCFCQYWQIYLRADTTKDIILPLWLLLYHYWHKSYWCNLLRLWHNWRNYNIKSFIRLDLSQSNKSELACQSNKAYLRVRWSV